MKLARRLGHGANAREFAFVVASGLSPMEAIVAATRNGARLLGIEQKLMPLHEAIWRMMGYAADRFRIPDRGRVAEGLAADLVVFDPDRIEDLATLTDPYNGCRGIERVFVNGVEVVVSDRVAADYPGRILSQKPR